MLAFIRQGMGRESDTFPRFRILDSSGNRLPLSSRTTASNQVRAARGQVDRERRLTVAILSAPQVAALRLHWARHDLALRPRRLTANLSGPQA